MPFATLTRRVTFAAAHRYWRPEWSAERNDELFGACAWPNYHGHSYVCEVTVRGAIDDETGMIVDLGLLDRVLAREVTARFHMRNINLDVPEFGEGRLIPTGENLARFICERVQAGLDAALSEAGAAGTARVAIVTVAEDETLRASWHAA